MEFQEIRYFLAMSQTLNFTETHAVEIAEAIIGFVGAVHGGQR